MRIAFRNEYVQALPEGHRFPMEKYDLLPRQLIHEGTISREQLFEPEIIEDAHVLDVHSSLYFERLTSLMLSAREQRVSGFPHDQKLIQRERMIMEVGRSVEVAYTLCPLLDLYDVALEVHADINTDPAFESNAALKEAMGYILSMGFVFRAKPDAVAASCCADKVI